MTTMGRPTQFHPAMCEEAHNYCLLGATNDQLADFFGVSPSTIDNWIAGRRDFEAAVKSGRVIADAKVARSLYVRAVGYDRKVEREVILGGALKPVTSTVHYPANVQACIFWLRNRRRRSWRDQGRDPGATQPTIRRARSTTSPCSMPPARACAAKVCRRPKHGHLGRGTLRERLERLLGAGVNC